MTYLELAHRAWRRTLAQSMSDPKDSQQGDEMMFAQTVANLRRLSATEREDYRAELAAAAPDDPWLAFDQEALRRAEAVLRGKETTP